MITATLAALALGKPAALTVTLVKKIEGLHPLGYAAAPSGSRVAVTLETNEVRIIDANTRTTLKTLKGHPQPPYAVAWSKDGTFIATGDESARIMIWNALTGERMKTIIGHIRGIQNLSFNSGRTMLASTGKDDVVNVWAVPSGKKVGAIMGKGANLYSAKFSPKTDTLLVGTLAGGARLYRCGTNGVAVLNYLSVTNPSGAAHEVLDTDWSSTGTRAATAGRDNNAVLWDVKAMKKIGSFKGHQDWVVRCAMSPNGRYLATSSSDRTVKVWDTTTFEKVADLPDQGAVGAPLCFTGDGKFLMSTGVDDSLEVYSLSPAQPATASKR